MKNILLGVCGSVACYKACVLASRLAQQGHKVDVLLTEHAAALIRPQLFAAITGGEAWITEFGDDREAMAHIALADRADYFLVAPATAGTIAKLAHGIAEDLLTTTALVLKDGTPRMVAPAMNPRMYRHPSVGENLARLTSWGWEIASPDEGWMACGDEGPGRLIDPEVLAQRVLDGLEGAGEQG